MPDEVIALTPRHVQVLNLLASGRNYVEIAAELSVSVGSVQSVASQACRRAGLPRPKEITNPRVILDAIARCKCKKYHWEKKTRRNCEQCGKSFMAHVARFCPACRIERKRNAYRTRGAEPGGFAMYDPRGWGRGE